MSHVRQILRLENVCKHFGGLAVIENLSFQVRRGARVALIGPNGAGKTTVFNIITGVLRAGSGRVFLEQTDITDLPSRLRIRHGVARNFQNIRLMPHLSTLENIMVGQHWRNSGLSGALQPVSFWGGNRWKSEARAALDEAGLGDYERAPVGSLPYGVQKRVELVRALMANPTLLLLDEPAAGLNLAEMEALQLHLRGLCKQRDMTLLVVEHDMQFVEALCEEVIVLSFGRKIAEGTPEAIRNNSHVQEIYLGAPTSEHSLQQPLGRSELSHAT